MNDLLCGRNLEVIIYLFIINLLVIQNFHLNPLHRHFKTTEKLPLAQSTLLHYSLCITE